MLRAGRLDRRIIIQVATKSTGTAGGESRSWGTLATVWAEYKPVRGSESFVGVEHYAEAEVRFTIRYRNDVTPDNRITYDGKTYDIVAVLQIGRKEALDILAKAAA